MQGYSPERAKQHEIPLSDLLSVCEALLDKVFPLDGEDQRDGLFGAVHYLSQDSQTYLAASLELNRLREEFQTLVHNITNHPNITPETLEKLIQNLDFIANYSFQVSILGKGDDPSIVLFQKLAERLAVEVQQMHTHFGLTAGYNRTKALYASPEFKARAAEIREREVRREQAVEAQRREQEEKDTHFKFVTAFEALQRSLNGTFNIVNGKTWDSPSPHVVGERTLKAFLETDNDLAHSIANPDLKLDIQKKMEWVKTTLAQYEEASRSMG